MEESVKAREKVLLDDLAATLNQSGKFIFRDGMVDEETWNAASIKILFLLKEPLDKKPTKNKDLVQFLRDGAIRGHDRTWKNITRWVYSARHCEEELSYSKDVQKKGTDIKKRQYYLKSIVAVNLKKHPGVSTISPSHLVEVFQKYYRTWLPRQLQLYKDADVIVCCGKGVRDCLVSVFEETFGCRYDEHGWKKYQYKEDVKIPYYRLSDNGPLIINYWHPSYWVRVSDRLKNNAFKSMIRDLVIGKQAK